jgi:hypothetical protein
MLALFLKGQSMVRCKLLQRMKGSIKFDRQLTSIIS